MVLSLEVLVYVHGNLGKQPFESSMTWRQRPFTIATD